MLVDNGAVRVSITNPSLSIVAVTDGKRWVSSSKEFENTLNRLCGVDKDPGAKPDAPDSPAQRLAEIAISLFPDFEIVHSKPKTINLSEEELRMLRDIDY